MISIVVPVYNSKRYISECFDSLETQTKKEHEIVLVDDGSTDGSGELCDLFAKKNPRVKVVHTQNRGLLLARRTGIKLSEGEYVAFLDSDDCIRQDFVEAVEEIIKNEAPDIVCFDFSRAKEVSFSASVTKPGLPLGGLYSGDDYETARRSLCAGYFNNMANKVIKRDVLGADKDFGEYAGLMHGEDWLQMITVVDNAKSVYYCDRPLYFYRLNEDASTYIFKATQVRDIACVSKELLAAANKWGSSFFAEARKGICRHAFLLLSGLATTGKTFSRHERDEACRAIAAIVDEACGREVGAVISSFRADYACALYCLMEGKYSAACRVAGASATLYRILSSSRKRHN